MKNKNDKRLLGAFDHIDDKYIESAAKRIKPRPEGIHGQGFNKTKMIKQVALLAACLVLLGAAVPLAGRLIGLIPEVFNPAGTVAESNTLETNDPENNNLPEEYFTDGTGILSYPSYFLGVEYDGCWIHKSGTYKDFSGAHQFFEFLYKYDPVAKESKSLCIDPACKHSDANCPVFVPGDWSVDSVTVFDDWCLYQITRSQDINEAPNGAEVRLYNMKTGEYRVIAEKAEIESSITYPLQAFVMDGKVYLNFVEHTVSSGLGVGSFDRHYVSCYDPATGATEFLCNVPGAMYMVGITNKRIICSEFSVAGHTDTAAIWTTDYSGENCRKMKNLTFRPRFVCGTYAYGVGDNETVLVYDLTTDTTSAVDFGEPIQYVFLDSGELGFTTTSRIEEFKEYQKDPDSYIAKNYPNMTDRETISRLKSEAEIRLNCKVKMQFYLTDMRGENKTLVFEGENIEFNPYRRVGDYIIGIVRKASKYEVRIFESGFAALNLKTGEIEMIPYLKFE